MVSCLLANLNEGSLSERCTMPRRVTGDIDALSSLVKIIWYIRRKAKQKNVANELGHSGKIETWDDLGHLFHVPHVPAPADWVPVLIRTNDLNPVACNPNTDDHCL